MEAAAPQEAQLTPSAHGSIAVVKLGGSVVRSSQLNAWLDAIADVESPLIVVPGGGALADEVRTCQRNLGFGDGAAHRMALLAMDQLAWAVAGMRPGFDVGTTEAELRDILARGRVAVWAPHGLIAGRTDLEATWRLTSDSLALWLAGRFGAEACYLIKSVGSVAASHAPRTAQALSREGIVDEAFPAMIAATRVRTVMFGQGDQSAFRQTLAHPATPAGLPIQ